MDDNTYNTWHIDEFQRVCIQLDTSAIHGLTSSEARRRLALTGKNKMTLPQRPEFRCLKYFRNCFAGLASVVFLAMIGSFVLHIWEMKTYYDREASPAYLIIGIVLLIVFLLSGALRYIQENDDFLVAWAFMDLMPMYCTVVRDSRLQIVRSEDVVLGDILAITYGERIAADVRIFHSEDLEVNNVALTGYSTSVTIIPDVTHPNKWLARNVCFACSHVTQGSGRGLVIACGDNSEVGIMARLCMEPRPLTRPRKHMKQVIFYKYVICLAMIVAALLSLTMGGLNIPSLIEFYISLTVSSSAIFLPCLIFVGLWITKHHLTEMGCYVRNMESVSSLGLTTVICSNLLGSMTQRRWKVSELFVDGKLIHTQSNFTATTHFVDLIRASILCNNATFWPGQRGLPTHMQTIDGTDYERALLKFAIQFVASIQVLRVKYKMVAWRSIDTISHLQVSVHASVNDDDETEYHLYIRGHWNEVMDHCSTCYTNGDNPVRLTTALRNDVINEASKLNKLGRHSYAFAYKKLNVDDYMLSLISNKFSYTNKNTYLSFMNTYSNSMCFLGLIAAFNPPYPDVIKAVAKCRSAGIKLVLLTRSDVSFSRAIAKAVGIFSKGSETAEDVSERLNIPISEVDTRMVTAVTVNMQNMSKQVHHQRWDIEQVLLSYAGVVFCRIAVAQRYLIIDTCLKLGAVVTAIGSSVHDTSAIRCAHVGVSESSSSHVSQSCADIIVLENNFVTVAKAIAESRLLFENQKKAVVYGLSTNMSLVMLHLLLVMLKMPVQISLIPSAFIAFFVNLIPATTLYFEPPELDLMKVMPKVADDFLINRCMLFVAYVNVGLMEAAAVIMAYVAYMLYNGFLPGALFGLSDRWYDDTLNDMMDSYGQEWTRGARIQLEYEMTSIIVITITIMQSINLVLCKTTRASLFKHGFGNFRLNLAFIYLIGICLLFTFANVPYHLQSLPVNYLPIFLYVFPVGILTIILESLRRYILRIYPGGWVDEVSHYGCSEEPKSK